MSKIKNKKAFLIQVTLICFILATLLTMYFLSKSKNWHFLNINISYVILIIIIAFSIYAFISIIKKIFKKTKSKNAIVNVDTTKIKEFGTSYWLQDDLNDNKKSLKEFHLSYNCSNKNCCKKNQNEQAGWVVSTQYRNKITNELLKSVFKEDYYVFDKKSHKTILDVDNYQKDLEKLDSKLKTDLEKYELTYHVARNKHVIALGGTGSGKTQKLILPGIFYNASLNFNEKPTMIITDPKGEIYSKTSGFLEQQGYGIYALNIRKATNSHGYNPLFMAWKYREDANKLRKEKCAIKTFKNLNSAKIFLESGEIKINNEKIFIKCYAHEIRQCQDCILNFENEKNLDSYEEGEEIKICIKNGYYYWNEELFKAEVTNEIKTLRALSEKEVISFAKIAIQGTGSGDQYWTDGARGYFIAIAITMLEIMDADISLLPLEKFNIPNILKMLDEEPKKVQDWYLAYCREKKIDNEESFGYQQAAGIVNAGENTKASLVSSAKVSTIDYSYRDLQGLLCDTKNLLDFEEIARGVKPYVVYLIVPDDDKSLHGLAATFVDQFYKTCVKIAMENKALERSSEETLTRQVQFYLDEFGNFPKIPTFPEMITVSRSRNIFFMLILQDYKQLESSDKYGKEDAGTIKSNCNISIYLKTTDTDTAELVSKEYGNQGKINYGANDNSEKVVEKKEKDRPKQEMSGNIQSIPLISAEELLKLNENLLIVKIVSENPARLNSWFSYKIKAFNEWMKIKKIQIPANTVDFMKDHYLNIFDTNYSIIKEMIKQKEEQEYLSELQELEIDHNVVVTLNDLDNDDASETMLIYEERENFIDNEINKKQESEKTSRIVDKYYKYKNKGFNNYEDIDNEEYESNYHYNMRNKRNIRSMTELEECLNLVESFGDVQTKDEIIEEMKRNAERFNTIREKYQNFNKRMIFELSNDEKNELNTLWDKQVEISRKNMELLKKFKRGNF